MHSSKLHSSIHSNLIITSHKIFGALSARLLVPLRKIINNRVPMISGLRFQYFVLRFGFGSVFSKTAVWVRFRFCQNRTAVSVRFRFCHLLFSSQPSTDALGAKMEWGICTFWGLEEWFNRYSQKANCSNLNLKQRRANMKRFGMFQ